VLGFFFAYKICVILCVRLWYQKNIHDVINCI